MKYEISHLDVMSVGKVAGVLYAVMGLFAWLMIPIFLLFPTGTADEAFATGFMIFMLLFSPVIYGVMGFIFGMIAAVGYNLLSKTFGGLRMTLNQLA